MEVIKMKAFVARAMALGIALGTTYVVGCSSPSATTPAQTSGGAGAGQNPGDSTGSLGLSLSTGGITIDSATYTITGPNGFMTSGTFAVGATLSTQVDGLPAGSGYTVTIAAQAGDAGSCSGSAPFDVMAGATTSVTVHLQCRVAKKPTSGGVSITGVVNICPTVDSLLAMPVEVAVGASVNLVASASDDDNGPGPLTYSWTASSGTIAAPTSANTSFTCTQVGTATITVSVSDSDCGDTASTTVTCDPATGVDAGTGPGEDTGAPEASVEETGAPETSVEETGAPETSTGTPDTGVAETGAPETSTGTPDTSVAETGGEGPPCGPGSTTTACLTSLDTTGACLACAQTNGCLDPAQLGGTCETTTGTQPKFAGSLPDGLMCNAPADGGLPVLASTTETETDVCLQTLGIVFTSKCAATFQQTPCLCGATDNATCLAGTATPTGPTYDIYACDFNTTSSTAIQSSNLTNQAFGAGQADALVQCLGSFGCTTCFGQ
jgi:hypothetical protein